MPGAHASKNAALHKAGEDVLKFSASLKRLQNNWEINLDVAHARARRNPRRISATKVVAYRIQICKASSSLNNRGRKMNQCQEFSRPNRPIREAVILYGGREVCLKHAEGSGRMDEFQINVKQSHHRSPTDLGRALPSP